jgi:hypothetical protein
MGFQLRQGISFCEVSDRLLFLDILADRYFCLQPAAERSFRLVVNDIISSEEDRSALSGMLETGVLIESPDAHRPHPFRLQRHASLSLLEDLRAPVRAAGLVDALISILTARLSLRFTRLHKIFKEVDLFKTPWPHSGVVDLDAIRKAAATFEATSRILRSHDTCLSRSLALARHLGAKGLPADLVIGVKLRPFAAHAWVQSGRWVVNDHIDTIRAYAPILAV